MPKSQKQTYELITYDVWGNARDGFEVNDNFSQGNVSLTVKAQVFNPGTKQEFIVFIPTDLQLNRLLGIRGGIWDGDKGTWYCDNKRNGKPICELRRV